MRIFDHLMELCNLYHEYEKFPIDDLDKGNYCSVECAARENYEMLERRFKKKLEEIEKLYKKPQG